MTPRERAEPGADDQVRRARRALAVRCPGIVLLGAVLLYVGGRAIADGEPAALWAGVLAVYAVAATAGVWLLVRGVREAGR